MRKARRSGYRGEWRKRLPFQGPTFLGHHVVDRGPPVGEAVPGSAARRQLQGEVRGGTVRILDVIGSEVDLPAGEGCEDSPAVVSPARPGRTRKALVLGEAVLGRLAQVCHLHRSQQATRGAVQLPESGAGEEA